MTTEEKLQHFYDFSIQSAEKEANSIITEYGVALENMFHEHQELKRNQAQTQLDDEVKKIKRDFNKTLSSEQLKIKRDLSKKQNELKDQLFKEVEAKLVAFKATPQYPIYLTEKVQEALSFASGDEMTIYMDPSDADFIEAISKSVSHPILVSKEDFLGGIRAVIPSKHILIDHSFVTMLRDEKEEFAFNGGTIHE